MSLRSILEELKSFDTALLANTIGYVDPTPAHEYYMGGSIRAVTPSLGSTAGIAFTCEIDTSTPDRDVDLEGYTRQLDEMSRQKEPVVWVVKTVGSRPDHECVMGDGMAKELHTCGCVGVVTDGGVRDVRGMLKVPFAAYASGTVIHHCAIRVRSIGQAIGIGGITVRPGDVIHADAEGVIKIPSNCLDKLAANARRMASFEGEAHEVFRCTDLTAAERHRRVQDLLPRYSFEKHGASRGHASGEYEYGDGRQSK